MTKGFQIGRICLTILLLFAALPLFAGSQSPFLFHSSGTPLDINDEGFSEIPAEEIQSFFAEVLKPCQGDETRVCISYSIQIPSEMEESQALNAVSSGLSLWGARPELNLDFIYAGVATDELYPDGLPYVYSEPDGDEEPVRLLDEFGQEILDGPFFISFDPPSEIEFSETEVSKIKFYLIPDLDSGAAEIKWAGVFINPAFNPFLDCDSQIEQCLSSTGIQSFSFASIIAAEAGRMLGLSASTLPTSIMYPSQSPSDSKVYNALRQDDLQRAIDIYASASYSAPRGQASGQILDGLSGEGWYGGSVLLIEESKIQSFVDTRSYNLVYASDISRKSGEFRFNQLPLGNYYVLIESVEGLSISNSFIDSEYQWLARSEAFVPEFYDGQGRESNLEASFSFSVQSYIYAAKISVLDSTETTPIQVITNQGFDTGFQFISASGANNEILSEFQPSIQSELIDQELQNDQDRLTNVGKASSCSLRADKPLEPRYFWIFLLLALLYLYSSLSRSRLR